MSKRSGNLSFACLACKRRKSKCNEGKPPCLQCRTKGSECIFDPSHDGRRQFHAKRAECQIFIDQIIQYIKQDDMSQLIAIRSQLRNGYSLAEAMATAQAISAGNDLDSSKIAMTQAELYETGQKHQETSLHDGQPTSYNLQEASPKLAGDTCRQDLPLQKDVLYLNGSMSPQIPPHLRLPLTISSDSSAGTAFTAYRDAARQLIYSGVPAPLVLGYERTKVDLFFRARTEKDDHSVTNWASEFCAAFECTFGRPSTLAATFLLTRLMRWIILPIEILYSKVPEMIRPTESQWSIPHDPFLDVLMLPAIRHALCLNPRSDILAILKGKLFFHWAGDVEDALEFHGNSICLSKLFESHATSLENWRVTQSLVDVFPELSGSRVKIVADQDVLMHGS